MAIFTSVPNVVEVYGTRKEGYDGNGFPSASVRLRCNYTDRWNVIYDVVTNARGWPNEISDGLSVQPWAVTASIVPEESAPSDPNVSQEYIAYDYAFIDVSYKSDGSGGSGGQGGGDTTFATESLEPTAEFITLNPSDFKWAGVDGQNPFNIGDSIAKEEAPGRLVRGLALARTIYKVQTIPAAVLTLPGCVNDAAYTSTLLGLTFDKETLLFAPPTTQRTITRSGDNAWTLNLKFLWKPHGWNSFWRASKGRYEYMRAKSQQTKVEGKFPYYLNYPLGSFSGLLN